MKAASNKPADGCGASRRRGMALIITPAFLVVITILVVGLASLMNVERPAASSNFEKRRAALLAQKQMFIKGFTEKLLCYALGRPIGYGDHMTVDEIMTDAAKHEYRLQEIIQATVASTFFQTK